MSLRLARLSPRPMMDLAFGRFAGCSAAPSHVAPGRSDDALSWINPSRCGGGKELEGRSKKAHSGSQGHVAICPLYPRKRTSAAQKGMSAKGHKLTNTAQQKGFYSITLSARASNIGGIVSPIALAVLRLIANSNLLGLCTGRSAGFSPRKILSTYSAPRCQRSARSGE